MRTIYQCSICGFQSSDENTVVRCEECHAKMGDLKITNIRWNEGSGNGFPDIVEISYKGKTHSYSF